MDTQYILSMIQHYALNLLLALIVFAVGWLVIKGILKFMRRSMEERVDPTLAGFLNSVVKVLLIILLAITALGTAGIEMTSFVAILGAASFAVGLALQGSLSNFAGGVILLLFRPFEVGDFIEAGGQRGTVDQIKILYTIIFTPDRKKLYIPNGSLANQNILNYTDSDRRRVDMQFGIGYDDDFEEAKAIINEIIDDFDRIFADPEPVVRVGEHAGSSVEIYTRVWIDPADYWPVYFHMHEEGKRRFDEEGIDIPYPQQDVHFDTEVSEGLVRRE